MNTQLSPQSQFLTSYAPASCDYFNNQMIKCVKDGFLSASVSAISCVMTGTLGEALKLLEDIKQPLEAILSAMKRDLIGVISAGAPCGVEIFLCLTKDFDTHLQCNDGDICNGDEYCSLDNICHNSNYIAPDGTQCYASGLVSGKCQEGVCVPVCQPGGIWNITTKLTGQKGTCKIVEDETVIEYKCLGSESFSISVSEDGINASLPGWSFNNNTCSGSASFSNGDGVSTANITFEANQITACKFTANYPSADCTCTWSCSGSKAQ